MLLMLSKQVTISRKDCWDWGTIASSKLSSLALVGVKHTESDQTKHTESDQTSCHATWSKSSKCVDRTHWQINVTPPGKIVSFLIVSDGRGTSITEAYSRGTLWRSDHKYDKKREVINNFPVWMNIFIIAR